MGPSFGAPQARHEVLFGLPFLPGAHKGDGVVERLIRSFLDQQPDKLRIADDATREIGAVAEDGIEKGCALAP